VGKLPVSPFMGCISLVLDEKVPLISLLRGWRFAVILSCGVGRLMMSSNLSGW